MLRAIIYTSFAKFLLVSAISGATSSVPDNQELVRNVTLEYACTMETVGSMKNPPYLTYTVKNGNSVRITGAELWYEVEFERNGQQGDKIRRDVYSIPLVSPKAQQKSRIWLRFLSGVPVTKCDAKIRGFYIVADPQKENDIIEVGDNEFIVAPDCKDDYAKLQGMKPGMEKREFGARFARSGCLVKKPADYNRIWVPSHAVESGQK